MAAFGILLSTKQVFLRNNGCMLESIAQTILKDVHADQTTAAYVCFGIMMTLYIHIMCCVGKVSSRHQGSLSDTSFVYDFAKRASCPGSLTDTSISLANLTCLPHLLDFKDFFSIV